MADWIGTAAAAVASAAAIGSVVLAIQAHRARRRAEAAVERMRQWQKLFRAPRG